MKFSISGFARIWRSLALAIVMSLATVQAIAEPDKNYLCFSLNGGWTDLTTATLQVIKVGSPDPIELEYSYDGITWREFIQGESEIPKIWLFLGYVAYGTASTGANIGKTYTGYTDVYIRAALATQSKTGKNATFSKNTSNYYKVVLKTASFESGAKLELSGNIMSLLDAECLQTEVPEYCFYNLFTGQTQLYAAPELPAMDLNTGCYRRMFYGCKGLNSAPELPATTLATDCYREMFYNCSAMNYMKVNFSSWEVVNATTNWVSGVAGSGTFVGPEGLPIETGASRIPTGWAETEVDETNDWLCITSASVSTTVAIKKQGNPNAVNLQYSHDGTSWSNYTIGNNITLNRKNNTYRVYFRSTATDNSATFSKDASNYYYFSFSDYVTVSGNVMSLLHRDCSRLDVPDYGFYGLFASCTMMKTAPRMPAYDLGESCYRNMYYNCASLYSGDIELPATTLAKNCYNGMFDGCTYLPDAPELPATTLAEGCYEGMFRNCKTLRSAPELAATTLATNSYKEMFSGCSSLEYLKVNFTDWTSVNATSDWVANVPESGTFIYNEGLPLSYGASRVPKDDSHRWVTTSSNNYLCFSAERNGSKIHLDKVGTPDDISLEYSTNDGQTWNDYTWDGGTTTSSSGIVTTIGHTITLNKAGTRRIYFRAKEGEKAKFSKDSDNYYKFVMTGSFNASGNIMSLLDRTMQQTSVPSYAFYRLFYGCAALKTAPKLPATELGTYCYRSMFNSCTQLANAPELPAVKLNTGCYREMFYQCKSLKEAPELPATTLASNCYNGMFQRCISLTEAPGLPATALKSSCYRNMFKGCTNLRYISVAFSDWGTQNATSHIWPYTSQWVAADGNAYPFSASGIFFGPEDLTQVNDTSLIPVGWNVNPSYLCLKAEQNGSVQLNKVGTPYTVELQYSTNNGGKWKDYAWNGATGTQINLSAGQKVYFRAKSTNSNFSKDADNYYNFKITSQMSASGNVALLLNGSTTSCDVSVPNYVFYKLFAGCENLTSAPELPTTTWSMSVHAYHGMFEGCTALAKAPVLPSTALAESCYESMFEGCESLTTAPTLPIDNNPAVACFRAMFKGCKALTNNLPDHFQEGNNIKESCYESMFEGCISLNKKIELRSMGLAKACYKGLFKGCTSLTSENLPTLSVESWAIANGESAFESMFEGCTSLTTPLIIVNSAVWGTYPKAMMRKMFKGCTSLNAPIILYASGISESCFESMYEGCTALAKAPSLPQTTLAASCYKRMFMGCTSLKNAPELPAKQEALQDSCYAYMFSGCTSLKYMDVNFNQWHFEDLHATYHWVENVSPVGTFMCPETLAKIFDESHIPADWSAEDNGDYLCFTTLTDKWTDLQLKKVGNPDAITYKYSTDRDTWTSVVGGTYAQLLGVEKAGSTVYIKCGDGHFSKDADNYWYFTATQPVAVSGNIMSLLDPTMDETDVPDYSFYKLFSGCTNIQDISGLKLPATEVGAYAYAKMFYGCTYLSANATSTPALPATTLGNYCYESLFSGWMALTEAPALPATQLAEGCYANLFKGCTALETAPSLPATTLADGCYVNLFSGCSSLTRIDVSFKQWVDGATDGWVDGVADEGEIECPWSMLQHAVELWASGDDYSAVYGASRIPKDATHPWKILLHTDLSMNYATGTLTISGGSPIYYSTDETLSDENKAEVGTRVDDETCSIDLNEWLNAATDQIDSISYYAIAGDAENGLYSTSRNSLTIYRMRKRSGYVMAKSADAIVDALYYADKVSSKEFPIRIFVPDGTYNLTTTPVVGDWVSLVGESLDNTIIRSSAADGALLIRGDYAYIQDIRLGSTNSDKKIAFRDNAAYDHTTLHIAMDDDNIYTFHHGTYGTRTSAPQWDCATDETQASVSQFWVNGSTVSAMSDATDTYLVEIWNGIDWDYTLINNSDFYVLSNLSGRTIRLSAANARGAFGCPCDNQTTITADGLTAYEANTVTLNTAGFASFSYDDNAVAQLRAIGASAYTATFGKDERTVTLTRINAYDVIPRGIGVVLFGLPNTTVTFYADESTSVNTTPYADVELPDVALIGNGNTTISRTEGDNKVYYGLSGNEFRKLSEKGTIKPNKAYFDLSDTESGAAAIRMLFRMQFDEDAIAAISNFSSAQSASADAYLVTGIRAPQQKGLIVRDSKVVLVK